MAANTTNTLFSSAKGAAQNDLAQVFSEYVTRPEEGRSGRKNKYKRQSTGSKQGMYRRTKGG